MRMDVFFSSDVFIVPIDTGYSSRDCRSVSTSFETKVISMTKETVKTTVVVGTVRTTDCRTTGSLYIPFCRKI